MNKNIKKIAILTSGGDAPGMNNAVRAAALRALALGIEPYLVFYGYKGLVENNIKSLKELGINLNDYINVGGTFIFSARYPEFADENVRKIAKDNLDKLGIDALLVIGGDGSYKGAQRLHEMGVKTVALPGTIDNDIASSDFTIGYDTALNTITEAVDKIRDTARSHRRCILVETMGHGASDLALYSGIATGAEIIVTNDFKLTEDQIIERVEKLFTSKRKRAVIVMVSEFIFDDIHAIAKKIEEKTKISSRAVVLAHMQRGGHPSARERIDATRMGTNAVDFLNNGHSGIAVGIVKGFTTHTPILEALAQPGTRKDEISRRTIKYSELNSQVID
ncbi:6-phosphofructokinase [Mycoplasmopsis agassizii]|uniref:6-phosphofructokinase n=1 Tax=Mycoplasmopsis agassizii TaxID=33922 RepID=UPI0009D8728B|nr:6-phosphofructokinase [Mycoplasmopsis agassizii]SMC16965.1 6-phosphofructokinase [Mycoplasmopsis agassizii]